MSDTWREAMDMAHDATQAARDAVAAAEQCAIEANAAYRAAKKMRCAVSVVASRKASAAALEAARASGLARERAMQRLLATRRRCGRLQYAQIKTLAAEVNAHRQAAEYYRKNGQRWTDLAQQYEPVARATALPGKLRMRRGWTALWVDTQALPAVAVTVCKRG